MDHTKVRDKRLICIKRVNSEKGSRLRNHKHFVMSKCPLCPPKEKVLVISKLFSIKWHCWQMLLELFSLSGGFIIDKDLSAVNSTLRTNQQLIHCP